MAEASYTNTQIDLREGDLILLYTDGVTEARNPAGEFFDDERVRQWLTAPDGRDVSRFTDGALRDLRVSGAGSPPSKTTSRSSWRVSAPLFDERCC
jgi:sigma-B regulation protein RsbU (phosphoserine phosphatase)